MSLCGSVFMAVSHISFFPYKSMSCPLFLSAIVSCLFFHGFYTEPVTRHPISAPQIKERLGTPAHLKILLLAHSNCLGKEYCLHWKSNMTYWFSYQRSPTTEIWFVSARRTRRCVYGRQRTEYKQIAVLYYVRQTSISWLKIHCFWKVGLLYCSIFAFLSGIHRLVESECDKTRRPLKMSREACWRFCHNMCFSYSYHHTSSFIDLDK